MEFDETIPTELVTKRNVRIFLALVLFWLSGAIYPILYKPRSYATLTKLEQKIFPESEKYKFDYHLHSNEVYAYLEKFATFYNHKAKLFKLTPKTYEGRRIVAVRLRFPKYVRPKRGIILVIAGEYAAAWDSVSAAIDLIHRLCEDCRYKVPFLIDYEWFIIPILNPDGYDYSLSMRDSHLAKSASPKNRAPIKNENNDIICKGVNLDRNFGFHWGESKIDDYKSCGYTYYAGKYPFSENETKALRNFIRNLHRRERQITMYIQLHGNTGKDIITYPWRFTHQKPFNQRILEEMVKGAAIQASNITGANVLYMQSGKYDLSSGLISDWLMGIIKVLYCFTIEPLIIVCNSTDLADQELYIEKARIMTFTLVKYMRYVLF